MATAKKSAKKKAAPKKKSAPKKKAAKKKKQFFSQMAENIKVPKNFRDFLFPTLVAKSPPQAAFLW